MARLTFILKSAVFDSVNMARLLGGTLNGDIDFGYGVGCLLLLVSSMVVGQEL